jgi:hypothetical protein
MEAAVPAIWKRERGRRASVLEVGAAALLIAGAAYLATSNSRINGPSVTFSQSAQHVDAYDFVEVSAAVRGAAANPFTDAAFTGSFETADHRRKWQVNGFCDSDPGNVFRIRFMPDAPGEYSYRVEYRQGESAFVKTGVFHAGNGGRRGSLRVDPRNRWHFIWEGTGEHYFFNGSTAYWLAGWRDENVIRSSIERFARLKVNRLRVTLAGRTAVLYGEPVIDGRNWTAFLTAWPAQSPKDIYHPGFNYKRFDIPYWQKFERLLRAAREKDIVISVVLDMADSRVHPEGPDEYRFLRYAIARLAAYSMLLQKGLIRVGIGIPAGADFTLEAVDDPYGYASAAELSLFRRPLPSTNLGFLSTVMWDGRETFAQTAISADLKEQSNGATLGHAQAATGIDDATQTAIVGFESALYTAATYDNDANAMIHQDCLVLRPNMWVDNKQVMEDGKLLV